MLTGGCRCGAIRYQARVDDPTRHALCHCEDCQRSAGAPAVAWLAVPKESFAVTQGEAVRWDGDGGAERYFCGTCGTGLYYFNEEVLPGVADIQSATLDDTETWQPGAQIQCADRLGYMAKLGEMPEFERYPAQ
ncbi:MAG TPA: GFA family protein [Croceibacterium sp.]|nr:GFA family protein [Croceibacterium sp.]